MIHTDMPFFEFENTQQITFFISNSNYHQLMTEFNKERYQKNGMKKDGSKSFSNYQHLRNKMKQFSHVYRRNPSINLNENFLNSQHCFSQAENFDIVFKLNSDHVAPPSQHLVSIFNVYLNNFLQIVILNTTMIQIAIFVQDHFEVCKMLFFYFINAKKLIKLIENKILLYKHGNVLSRQISCKISLNLL